MILEQGISVRKIIGLLAVVFCVSVQAQKIGVVDINQVMANTKETAEIKKQLETKYRPKEQSLVELQNNIQEEMKKLQRDNTILTDEQKQKMQQDIIAKRKDFEEKARNFQQEVNQAQNAAMQKLFNKVKGIVDSVAKSEKYDLILQKEAVQFSASDANDITPKVIAKLK